MLSTLLLSLAIVASSSTMAQQTVTIQPLSGQTLGCFIQESNPDQFSGDAASLSVGWDNFATRSILTFDLTGARYAIDGVPAGSKIISATLTLYCETPVVDTYNINVYRMSDGFEVQPAVTTWNKKWDNYIELVTEYWTTPGGEYDAYSELSVAAPTAVGSFDVTGMVDMAQDALDLNGGDLILLFKAAREDTFQEELIFVGHPAYLPESTAPILTIVYEPRAYVEDVPSDPPDDAEDVRDITTTAGWVDVPIGSSRTHTPI